MANALFVDALLGYQFYIEKRGKASISDINALLTSNSRREISLRTFTHYRNLYKNGFTNYIPINKFDVFRALGKIYAASDRRAFPRRKAKLQGQISRNAETWEEMLVQNISPIGLGGQTSERFPVRPGSPIWIIVDGYSTIPATVIWRRHHENKTLLGLRTLQYLQKYRIRSGIKKKEDLTGRITIIRNVEGEIDWKGMFVVFEKLQQILGALEEFIFTVEELSDTTIPISPTVLRSISFGSPGNGVFGVDINLAEILKSVYLYIVDRKLLKKKLVAEVRTQELGVEKQRLEIIDQRVATDLKEIEVARNALQLARDVKEISKDQELLKILRTQVPKILDLEKPIAGLLEDGSVEAAIITKRVVPPLLDIVAGDDVDYDLTVETESDVKKNKPDEE